MNSASLETLRQKLRKRADKIQYRNIGFYHRGLGSFLSFLEEDPVLKGLLTELLFSQREAIDFVRSALEPKIDFNRIVVGNTVQEQAAIGYEILRACVRENKNIWEPSCELQIGSQHSAQARSKLHPLETFKEEFILPLYEYLDEKLESQHVLLHFLIRYKQLIEWFERDRLRKLFEKAPKPQEDYLALDIYRFLFLQGLEFHITPHSVLGRIDFISELREEGRLLFDAKIFRGDKHYIAKGCNQLYSYLCQYNQPWGALAIFDVSEHPLSFALSLTDIQIPFVQHNGKTVFLLTIDIAARKSASERGVLKVVEISSDYILYHFAI